MSPIKWWSGRRYRRLRGRLLRLHDLARGRYVSQRDGPDRTQGNERVVLLPVQGWTAVGATGLIGGLPADPGQRPLVDLRASQALLEVQPGEAEGEVVVWAAGGGVPDPLAGQVLLDQAEQRAEATILGLFCLDVCGCPVDV